MDRHPVLCSAASLMSVPAVSFVCPQTESDAAVRFNDGRGHVVNTDIRPDYIEVFDSCCGNPKTVRIESRAIVGTEPVFDSSFTVFDESLGEIFGAFLENDVEAVGNSTINIFGGTIIMTWRPFMAVRSTSSAVKSKWTWKSKMMG